MSLHFSDWLNMAKNIFIAAAPVVSPAIPGAPLSTIVIATIISQLEKNVHTADIINRLENDPNLHEKIAKVENIVADVEAYLKSHPTQQKAA